MDIIARARWGARYARGFAPAPLPAKYVYLHHSVTIAPDLVWVDADGDGVEDDEERAMRTLEDIGQQRFGGGISYTFAVMPSGRVYEGHGVDRQGAHTKNLNNAARAIVLVGNYELADLTAAQYRAIAELLQHGKARGWWTAARLTGGHRDAPGAQTACPGNRAYRAIPEINRLAAGGLPAVEDDVDWNTEYEFGRTGLRTKFSNWIGETNAAANDTRDGINAARGELAALSGKVDGLLNAVAQLAAGDEVDLAAIRQAAEDGTRKALAEGTVDVDISVAGASPRPTSKDQS